MSTATRPPPARSAEVDVAIADLFGKLATVMPTMSEELRAEALSAVARLSIPSLTSPQAVEFARDFASRHMFFNLSVFLTEFRERFQATAPTRTGAVEQTRDQIRQWRKLAADAMRERREIDRRIEQALVEDPDTLREIADRVLDHEPEEVRAFIKAPGYLVRPVWRGMVAAALKARSM
jgi:hypothetical protein